MLSGNKGEWSEIYVFLKLLADGKIDAADADLNAIPNVYYPIIKILRQEATSKREYVVNREIKIIDGNTNNILLAMPVADFVQKSQELFSRLKAARGRSFQFPDIEIFLNSIKVTSLTALKTDKTDIRVVVHDLNTGLRPTLGFSIKSMLGKNSTLFNPGQTTNFIYEITGVNLTPQMIRTINAITTEPKISNRLARLTSLGARIKFRDIASKNLKLNLQLIDSDLPEILGYLLLYKYTKSMSKLADLLTEINNANPLNFDLSLGHPFYDYKIKNFLTDSALGMTPAALWTGQYDATGGIIVVKESGDLVCYHIYNRNEFQSYLTNNTRLEQASTSRYDFGEIYQENGQIFIKLNLQVRFN